MTVAEIRRNHRDCAAQARREKYMRANPERAASFAYAARLWLAVMRLAVERGGNV